MYLVLALALGSCGAMAFGNSTTAFVSSRQSNVVQHDFFGHVMQLAPVLVSHDANGIVNGTLVKMIKTSCNMTFGYVMP